jgi:glycosyltransferase involved in cell wall biosynthesis
MSDKRNHPPIPAEGADERLGVVVPTLNCASFLADTLASIRRAPIVSQIVVADSCSTDGSLDIAAAAGVDILRDAPKGLYAAVNAGIRRLSTPWVTYLNGDDVFQSLGITRLFAERTNYDVLYGPVDFITQDGAFLHCWHSARPSDVLPLFRSGVSPVLQQGTLFRRSLFEALGGFSERWRFVSDADFWWRAAEAGARFHRITHPPVASFRMHPGQLSHIHKTRMHEEFLHMAATHASKAGALASWWRRSRYRAANGRSYLLRALRQGDLSGRLLLRGSYDF